MAPSPAVGAREQRRAIRAAAVVQPAYPPDLPVAAQREAIQTAIRSNQVVVVQADTGSGKTTQLPKMLLEMGHGVEGEIAHTQPRRLAARATAQRIASELGVPLGTVVGCQVRFDDRSDQTTRLRVLTDGVLLAQLAQDRLLKRYDAIVIDEVHERSLNVDFLLGSLRRILPRRPELRVVLASATMDARRLADAFGGAPVLDIPGRLFPVEVRWRPPAEGDPSEPQVVADAVEACLAEGPGDILVFLPGEREINEAVETLRGRAACREVDVLPLFGRLGDAEQDRAIASGLRRRVTVATNVAETSLTVPGIRWVVDAGLVRLARWSPKARVQRLLVEPAAKASLQQRMGRAGRVAPGVCVRLFDQADMEGRSDVVPPEILRSNLAGVVLRMKDLGLGEPSDFPFVDPPGDRRLQDAEETLRELGAVTGCGELTRLGRQMARLPVDPRVARVLIEGVRLECGDATLTLAAWMSVVDPRERPTDRSQEADLAHLPFRDGEGDLIGALRLWQAFREAQATLGSSALKRWCRERHLSHRRLREWADVRRQLDRLLRERVQLDPGPELAAWRGAAVHRAVLAGFATSVARRGRDGLYQLPDGSTFSLHPRSGLARSQPPWVVATEIVDTGRRMARVVARVQPTWVERAVPHMVRRTLSEPHWVQASGQVAAWERVSLGQLDLIDRRRVPYGPVHPAEARVVFIRSALVEEQLGVEPEVLRVNRMVRDQADAWAKSHRRLDLLADADAAFRFYEQRLPPDVHSRPHLLRWLQQPRHAARLQMQLADLVPQDADAGAYPALLDVGAGPLPVFYRHEPGTETDGATLRVPLVLLPDLDAARLSWGVPGARQELVEALIRALPKRVRTRFQPVEAFVQGFLQSHGPAQGDLLALLAAHLSAAGGLPVDPADFDRTAVPAHLLPRVEVLQGERVRGAGRDVRDLQRAFAADAAAARAACVDEWLRGAWSDRPVKAWPAGVEALPEERVLAVAGGSMRIWLTLHMGEAGPVTAWAGDLARAERMLQRAVLAMLLVACRGPVQHHLDFSPEFRPLEWSARGLGSPARLVHVASLQAVQRACLSGHPPVRSERELESALARGQPVLLQAARQVMGVLEEAARVQERLDAELARPAPTDWTTVVRWTRQDQAWALGESVLEWGDGDVFLRLPEMLQACLDRLQRLAGGGVRQVEAAMHAVEPWLQRATASGDTGLESLARRVRLGLHARGGGPWPRLRDLPEPPG
jgi:ATP-dependent helicase HrpA